MLSLSFIFIFLFKFQLILTSYEDQAVAGTDTETFLLLIVNHDSRHRTWIISRAKISSHALFFERWEFSKK